MRSSQPVPMPSDGHAPVRAGVRPRGVERPDPMRIAGISGTLLLNSGLFMLMLVPMARPDMLQDMREPQQTFRWITEPAKPPLPPVEVPVVMPRTTAPVAIATPRPVSQPAPVVVEAGDLPADPMQVDSEPAVAAVVASIEPPQPSAGKLQYASAPPPPYPRDAMAGGVEGTVLLKVVVGIDGVPSAVSIHRSSGNRRLDESARRHVLKLWRFQPASVDGVAVEAVGIVPIEFNLDRG